jgi:hypothetical protein
MLLDEIKNEQVRNFKVDEDGFFREIEDSKKNKF